VGQKSKKKIKSKRTKMNILKILRRELLHSLIHNSVLLVHHCMNDDTSRQPTEYEAAKEKKRKKEKMKRKSFSILGGHELNVVFLGNLARSITNEAILPYTRQWWIDHDRYSSTGVWRSNGIKQKCLTISLIIYDSRAREGRRTLASFVQLSNKRDDQEKRREENS
jgi:hypothetical protein